MGYKKSFNLVTLQLIMPLSTMTKAEYKNSYGIDLDDIDIEKVTLLQDEGSKNKYFVDEIKTTENGVDIYAGGKILSIGESSVSVIENAYSVDNAKPIYYHPIYLVIRNSGVNLLECDLAILDNSSEPYTKDNIISKLKALMGGGAIININGCASVENVLYPVFQMYAYAGIYNVDYFTPSVRTSLNLDTLLTGSTVTCTDGVNKIN